MACRRSAQGALCHRGRVGQVLSGRAAAEAVGCDYAGDGAELVVYRRGEEASTGGERGGGVGW